MNKKKIIKLEINKEEILNLSQTEFSQIVGGDNVLTVDIGDNCPASQPVNCNPGPSEDCTTPRDCYSDAMIPDACGTFTCGGPTERNCYTDGYWACTTIRT